MRVLAEVLRSLFDDWQKRANWIRGPLGYVLLPRAMLEIGKALYPNEWIGTQPTTPVFLPLPHGKGRIPEERDDNWVTQVDVIGCGASQQRDLLAPVKAGGPALQTVSSVAVRGDC